MKTCTGTADPCTLSSRPAVADQDGTAAHTRRDSLAGVAKAKRSVEPLSRRIWENPQVRPSTCTCQLKREVHCLLPMPRPMCSGSIHKLSITTLPLPSVIKRNPRSSPCFVTSSKHRFDLK